MDHHSKIQGAIVSRQGRLRPYAIGLVLMMGMAAAGFVNAHQQSCQAVFPEAVQSHKADGEITFDWNAQLLGNTDNSLAVVRANNASWSPLPSCGSAACVASGASTEAVNIHIDVGNSKLDHQVGYQGNSTLGSAQQKSFRTINVGSSAQLSFASIAGEYQIKKLQLGYASTLNLAPGTYWIDDLILSSETKINVTGNGTARIYVKGNLQFPYKSYANMQAEGQPKNASRLFIYTQGNVDLQTHAEVSAIVYAKGRLSLSLARLYGAASFHQATIGTSSKVIYQSQAMPGANLGGFCIASGQAPSSSSSSQSSSSSSSANTCRDVFSNGLQTHSATGTVEFKYNAQLRSAASPILNTQSIKTNPGSHKPSCESGQCSASGLVASKFQPVPFTNSNSSVAINVPWATNVTLGTDGMLNYGKITVATSASIHFVPQQESYKIKELSLGYSAIVQLPAGDYWVETLKLDSDSHIQVIGAGTVRLFVKNAVNLNWMASINKNTADASKLILYAYGNLRLKSSSQVTGLVYALEQGDLDYSAQITGALSASDIVLDTESAVIYKSDAVSLANFGLLCDEDEPLPDLVPPELTINPLPAETEQHEITVSGTVSDPEQDGSGVASVIIKLASGVQRTAQLNGNDYSALLPLAAGNNAVTVEARDFSDNLTTRTASIKRISLPLLEILSPEDDVVTTQPGIRIHAKISTAWPVAEVSASVNDVAQTLSVNAEGYYAFEILDVALVLGTNEFRIQATTPDGIANRIIQVVRVKPDRDGDGRPDDEDRFPDDPTEWSDLDNDGIGDNSDPDRDGDGFSNEDEIAVGTNPDDPENRPSDIDNDGIPDDLDDDRDGDGHNNDVDQFPDDATEWGDMDGDGIGDNSDADRDGDGYANDVEVEEGSDPNNPASKPADIDNDGIPDSKDADRDGDGHSNDQDAFPNDPTEWSDLDSDGIGDNSDTDRDGDGYSNEIEIQEGTDPDSALSKPIDTDNDGIPDSQDADRDGDGHNNDVDAFPDDASEWSDIDGDSIGDNTDEDRDGDGINNDYETQAGTDPNDSSSTPDDGDTDGIPDVLDTDRDGDGYNNDQDKFPSDPTEWADLDNDGIGDNADTDRDGDGFNNDVEQQNGTNPADASDYPDTVSPLIQITNPANQQTEAATYLLQGTVSDPVQPYSGIANVTVTNNRYENAPVVAVVEGSSFTATAPLALGANTLTVRAVDSSGNPTEALHQVQRIALPHFSNILPTTGSVITEKTVTVSGQVQTAMPLEQVRFYLNEWQITPSGTSQPDVYTFSLPGIPLQLGSNTFILRAETPDGAEQQSLVLVHNPENPDAIKAPEVSLIAPLNNTQLRDSSFTIKGRVTSYAGAVSVTVNGHAALVKASGGDTYYFEDLLAFANGQEQLTAVIEATDALNKRTQLTANYFLDNTGPQIQLAGLSPSPTVNPVAQSPVNIMGLVSDTNLASVTVNDNPVRVAPTSVAGQYAFALPLTLAPGAEVSWAIAAFDRSGNKSQVEYIFKSSAQASIDPLLPAASAEFIGNTEPLSVQVAARVGGLVGSNKVVVSVGATSVELAIAGTLASGDITVPPTAGAYVLNYQVLNENQEVIASTTRNFSVRNEQDIPVQLLRHEPENNEDLVEPNQPIELYFNKPIDTTKLDIKVYETLHGKTYLNLDPAGLDFINAKGYQLMDVNRDRELVTGGTSVLPDGKMIAFYPSRQFGFGGTLYVDVKYNNEELTHFTFKVRKLPTFVIGGIVDQFGQPLAGITVTLPELGRTTITNKDGGFAFGAQEPAGKEIPGGRYKLHINPDFSTQGYGTQVRSINLQEGFKNEIPIIRLTELHPSIPFQLVSSNQAEASFVGDALRFDFSEARLLFNEGRSSGQLQYQFFQYDQLGTAVAPGAWPQWMYAGQPRGVEVEGKVGIKMNIPQRDGSYDYIPEVIRYVFIMGYNPEREVIEPVGIGEITNHQVVSVGKVALKTLDFVGYAWVHPDFQQKLEAVANGQLSMQQLISEMQQ